jgi:hypothetical protein
LLPLTPITLRLGKNNEAAIRRDYIFFAESKPVTIILNHFSAATIFALFASIVFGITHRDTVREMVRYGFYCFAMFLGGVIAAGWLMWLLRR